MKQKKGQSDGTAAESLSVMCSLCGVVISANSEADIEQMCLICHARMLNDHFQRLRKVDGGGRF
jgi:hypothetical protein